MTENNPPSTLSFRAGAWVALFFVVLWLVITINASSIAPWLMALLERVEVFFGWDVSLGEGS